MLGEEKMLGGNKKGATSPASKKSSPDAGKVRTVPIMERARHRLHMCVTGIGERSQFLFKPASRLLSGSR